MERRSEDAQSETYIRQKSIARRHVQPKGIKKRNARTLGITSFELQQELNLGWIRAGKRYSAEKAQFSLK